MSFAHFAAMSRPGVETQWFETKTETRLRGNETKTLKKVSRDSRCLEAYLEISTSLRKLHYKTKPYLTVVLLDPDIIIFKAAHTNKNFFKVIFVILFIYKCS